MSPRVNIVLCGQLKVQFGELDPARFSALTPQAKLAFVYLVLNRDRPVSRDELIDNLWPEQGGRGEKLSPVLSKLRAGLPSGVLPRGDPIRLLLDGGTTVDVELANDEIQRARELSASDPAAAHEAAATAAERLKASFLPGMKADFVSECRTLYEERRWEAVRLMLEAALAGGTDGVEQLIAAARQLLEAEPEREEHWALAVRVFAAAGDWRLVADTCHALAERSRQMPWLRPQKIEQLKEELLEDRAPEVTLPPALRRAAEKTFVGREPELEKLGELWARARDQLSVILIEGEGGVGKTHLVANFASWAQGRGARVLYGQCDEDSVLSYQPFLEALRGPAEAAVLANEGMLPADLAHLALLFPELARREVGGTSALQPDRETGPLFRSVSALVGRLMRRDRILLFLDDMHWADEPTIHLLHALCREHRERPITVICTYRPDEIDPKHPFFALRVNLGRDLGYRKLRLAGMSVDEALELVQSSGVFINRRAELGPGELAALASSLCSDTMGNPFFMSEILRALDEDTVDIGELRTRAVDRVGVPFQVEDVIRRRLARLSSSAKQTVEDAAVIGLEFDCWVLARISAGSGSDAERSTLRSLAEAESAGLVVDRGDGRFVFCHAIVRRALEAARGGTARSELHKRALEALVEGVPSRRYVPAAELAHHAFEAHKSLPVRAVSDHLERAAEEAIRAFAYEDAAREYERASVVLSSSSDREDRTRQAHMLIQAGRTRLRAGQDLHPALHRPDQDAGTPFRRAIEIGRDLEHVEIQADAVLGLAGRYYEARAREQDVVFLLEEILSRDPGATRRARLLARLAEVLHFQGEPGRSIELADEATQVPGAGKTITATVAVQQARVISRLDIALHEERESALSDLVHTAQTLGVRGLELAAEACHWRTYTDLEACRLDSARGALHEMEQLAGRLRQPLLEHLVGTWKALFAGLEGRFAEAEDWAERAQMAGRRAQTSEAVSLYWSQLFSIHRDQGKLGDDIGTLELIAREFPGIAGWRALVALAHLEAGDFAAGQAGYEQLTRAVDEIPRNFYWSGTMGYLCDACWLLEDTEGAEVLYGLLRPFASQSTLHRALMISSAAWFGSVDRFLGMMATLAGRPTVAAKHFDRALDIETKIRAEVALVRTQLAYAWCERSRGTAANHNHAEQLEREAASAAGAIGMALPGARRTIATA